MSSVNVDIEYCGGWGYASRYRDLERQISKQVPQAKVSGSVGRRTAFEVKVNDSVIHSKLSEGSFPDFDEVTQIVIATASGSEPTKVTKMQSALCKIL